EHQSGDYLCTITITGNVVLAEQLIHERLAEQYQPRDGWASKIVDVDPTVVGQVIGPGGANLRHIFDTTGCKIKFIQAAEVDPMAMPGKQVACIRGPPDRLHEGEEALRKKIRDVESRRSAPMMRPPMPMGKGVKGLGGYVGMPADPWAMAGMPRGPPPGPVKGGKVIPCRFHLKTPGMCKNGASCPFSHDPAVIAAALGMAAPNINPNAPTYKTTMCRYFEIGQCARGASCSYAHGDHELRCGLR
ncbi:unnamed protein product, partial [Effrenium voratum]